MKFSNVYFINGTAYAGKSTLVKKLAEKYSGVACEENYHDRWEGELDKEEFPGLNYTRDLEDWHDFVRRTPDEYEAWINQTSWECEKLELRILDKLVQEEKEKPIFVDTNVHIETLKKIVPQNHVLIMLADPEISVKRFFERPDREKQFLYRLMLEEENPDKALENFRQCLARINSQENYNMFLNSGFHVLHRDESRSVEETVALAAKHFGLSEC